MSSVSLRPGPARRRAQLVGTRLAELAHADAEKPDTRIDVDLGEQRLGGAANHMGLVGRLGDGGRAGDRREIPKPNLELNRSSRDARLVKASRNGVHHPDQLSAEHGSVGEVTGKVSSCPIDLERESTMTGRGSRACAS